MMKRRLFTPGPTPVPEQALLRMAEPIIHHRKPEYIAIAARVNANLRTVFGTARPVLTLASSGTGGVEASFVNLFSPGDKVIAINGGKFGERWVELPRAFGLEAVDAKVEWGSAMSPDELGGILRAHPDAKAVYITQSETSTGTVFDVRGLAAAIRKHSSALVCVDAISALGAHELRFDDWGVDVCVTGSQKGLMIPPGLAFIALSARAEAAMAAATLPRFYFDLRQALKAYETNDTPWTPAVSLVTGLDVALGMIVREGIEAVWTRHARMGAALRAGVRAMGLELASRNPSDAVTAIRIPPGVAWKTFNRTLEDRYGIIAAGGQGAWDGKVFRISHLGYYDELDMVTVAAAIERAFSESGFAIDPGSGVSAVQASFMKAGEAREARETLR
jgi:aspartate aminotransferase-like enzyme